MKRSKKIKLEDRRNVLLIGRTGQGKSSLANIIINDEKNFEEGGEIKEVFKESGRSISQTKKAQTENVTLKIDVDGKKKNVRYKIIDTVGIDDTTLSKRKVLVEIAKGCKKVKRGINQILFVCGERLTPQEIEAYNILRRILFDNKIDKDITKYTTIIRTKFENFCSREECENDIQSLLKEKNEALIEMIQSCDKRIIHLNTPSINIKGEGVQNQINVNKEARKKARKILMNHLVTCKGIYKPESLDKIDKRIKDSLINETDKLQKQLEELLEQERLYKLERSISGSTLEKTKFSEELLKERRKYIEIKEKIDETLKKMNENEECIERGLFEAIGRGFDKLVEITARSAENALCSIS
ncbi:25398_t:CDS:1 [Gigaspora margarita]|uniref:25398_t:CDS:1 n=1 Tax=Gigaspora margarita TaxID=4874 RepID=A0ABN7UEJ0_GIGMA|nr:25398_t:CDS:1 [Gigaspora margarita]